MRIRIDKWLVVLTVIALSTLSWWMPVEEGPVATLASGPEKRHIADFNLSDFDLTIMNAAGRPRYRMQGQAMIHYADDDSAEVTLPEMTLYRHGAVPWVASAGQAQVEPGGETVVLQDKVKLERLTTVGRDKLELQTPLLRVVPDKKYAETTAPVTIITDLGVTRAVGMQADLEREHLELLAQVRGDYAKQ